MIRVLIADDEALVRQGIRKLLELDGEVEVVAEAADGHEALARIAETRPEVVLLDLKMPRCDGLGVLAALASCPAAPPCLVLTTFDDRELFLQAARGGAAGYLRKDVSLAELLHALRTLAAGGTYLQPALTEGLLRGFERLRPGAPAPEVLVEALTPREVEVLRLVAQGLSNREIAGVLGVAEGTVKIHVSAVLGKLAARDRTQAVLRALERGVL